VESFISLCQSPNITLRILNISHIYSDIYFKINIENNFHMYIFIPIIDNHLLYIDCIQCCRLYSIQIIERIHIIHEKIILNEY